MMTKLPNKQYKTHTTINLHGETVAMTILAGLLLDPARSRKFDKIHQCKMKSTFTWTNFYKIHTSSILCFGEPTLEELNQVKLLCSAT